MDTLKIMAIAAQLASILAILVNAVRVIDAKRIGDPNRLRRGVRLLAVSLVCLVIAWRGSRFI